MNPPTDPVLQKVQEWVEAAEEDLLVAEYLLTLGDDCPFRMVAYHAQQCCEKYFKSFLVMKSVDFPHTHNIARLRELCVPLARWADQLKPAEELSPYAISTRYPGVGLIVTEPDSREAIRIAQQVRTVVGAALNVGGLSL